MKILGKKGKNFGIFSVVIFFLTPPAIFSLTAKPGDGKPCEPPPCKKFGEERYYFCVGVTVRYKIECIAVCTHSEGIGYERYECQPKCCFKLVLGTKQ
jgi:hypothetical protein